MKVRLDLNNPEFQKEWFNLSKAVVYHKFVTRHSAETEVLDYITYYISLRLHSTLGYKTPMVYEQKLFQKVA
jgi:hypothetical protein